MRSFDGLRRRAEFAALRRRGTLSSRPTLSLYRAAAVGGRSRVGISVGTGVGCAVVRNTVRRRISAALHELLNARAPQRLLVVAKPPAAKADFHRLRSDLQSALEAGPTSR